MPELTELKCRAKKPEIALRPLHDLHRVLTTQLLEPGDNSINVKYA